MHELLLLTPMLMETFQYVLFVNTDYSRKVEECAPDPVPPEYRLYVAMIGAPLLTGSLFWFA